MNKQMQYQKQLVGGTYITPKSPAPQKEEQIDKMFTPKASNINWQQELSRPSAKRSSESKKQPGSGTVKVPFQNAKNVDNYYAELGVSRAFKNESEFDIDEELQMKELEENKSKERHSNNDDFVNDKRVSNVLEDNTSDNTRRQRRNKRHPYQQLKF